MSAPPGAASFRPADLARLPAATLRLVLAPGPAAPPLEDVAAALRTEAGALFAVAAALPPARAERLLRLSQRPVSGAEAEAAAHRLVAGLFWPLVYELAPDRWRALAEAEAVHPDLVAQLPVDGARVLEVAAGSGRLTLPIAARARWTVAVEPAEPLRGRLSERLGARGAVIAALSQALPFPDDSFDVVLACTGMAPEAPLGGEAALAELERVARRAVLLVGPEDPSWFMARGYRRRDFPLVPAAAPAGVTEFFGPLDPPRTLLQRELG